MNQIENKVVELTTNEYMDISGGDRFLYDLGNSIGIIGRWFSNISYPAEQYSNVMAIRGV